MPFLRVISILEEDSHQFQWKLSRNTDGLSLVISTRKPKSKEIKSKTRHATAQPARTPAVRRKETHAVREANLEKDGEITSSTKQVSTRVKRKSPSTIARDKARLKAFQVAEKKKKPFVRIGILQKL